MTGKACEMITLEQSMEALWANLERRAYSDVSERLSLGLLCPGRESDRNRVQSSLRLLRPVIIWALREAYRLGREG